jgi:hypothetical protein
MTTFPSEPDYEVFIYLFLWFLTRWPLG